jgi:hypothetical protein
MEYWKSSSTWIQAGGPADAIEAGDIYLYALSPTSHEVWQAAVAAYL